MSAAALARARSALGVPFRLHGRDLSGMDCVGLAAFAWQVAAPTGYAMRCGSRARIEQALAALGFVAAPADAGSVLLANTGPGQLHLAIATGEAGVIHADAVARRVVERAAVPWPILAAWKREE